MAFWPTEAPAGQTCAITPPASSTPGRARAGVGATENMGPRSPPASIQSS